MTVQYVWGVCPLDLTSHYFSPLFALSLPPTLCFPFPPPPCSHLDQSLFTRFIRLGTPYVELNAQVGEGGGIVSTGGDICVWAAGGRGAG